jgi:hypothetical protein
MQKMVQVNLYLFKEILKVKMLFEASMVGVSSSSVELLVRVEMLKMREDVVKVEVEVSTVELLASSMVGEVFVAERVVLALLLRVRQNCVCWKFPKQCNQMCRFGIDKMRVEVPCDISWNFELASFALFLSG